MPVQLNTVLYPVKDLDKAKAFFAAFLGVDPHVDSPYYVGFSVNGAEIGLLPEGLNQGMTGPVPFFDVDDISTSLGDLKAAGAQVIQEPTDVGAGMLVAKVKDANDNDIGLRQLPAGA